MGWPESGPVSDSTGQLEELVTALNNIEAHGGKVPFNEAIKIAALINPKSPQAYYLQYRSKKNLPPL
jgi:hypothetical protein